MEGRAIAAGACRSRLLAAAAAFRYLRRVRPQLSWIERGPPKAEVRGSNPFGRASKQNQWVTADSSGISGSY